MTREELIPIKVEADALEIGIAAGIFTKEHAIRWADLRLAESEGLSTSLAEISTGEQLDASSFAQLLASVPGAGDRTLTKQILLAALRSRLAQGKDRLKPVVHALAQLSAFLPFTPSEQQAMYQLDDGYDLAISGTYGTVDQIWKEAVQFLATCDTPVGKRCFLEGPTSLGDRLRDARPRR